MGNQLLHRVLRGVAVVGLSAAVAVSSVSVPASAAPLTPDTVAPAVLEVRELDGRVLSGAELREFLAEDAERNKAVVADLDSADAADASAAGPGDKIVSIAAKELGTGEKPNGSNCTKYSKMCVAWCSLFATWAWRKAGVNIPQYPFTGDVYKWGQRHKKSYNKSNLKKAAKGDVLLFGTGPSSTSTSTHIGIIKSVSGSSVTLIEGNSQNKVRQVKRTLSSKTFYGGTHP